MTPDPFYRIGIWYDDFAPVSDASVLILRTPPLASVQRRREAGGFMGAIAPTTQTMTEVARLPEGRALALHRDILLASDASPAAAAATQVVDASRAMVHDTARLHGGPDAATGGRSGRRERYIRPRHRRRAAQRGEPSARCVFR
jgi:hypothetical protein